MTETIFDSVTARIGRLDWDELQRQLDDRGFAVTTPVLSEEECAELAGLFESDRFRSTIDMARHRFGDGRYRYFAHPLPETSVWCRSPTAGPACCRVRTRHSQRAMGSCSNVAALPARSARRR